MKTSSFTETQNESALQFFGTTPNDIAVHSYLLKNKNGMQAEIITYGATVKSLKIPVNEKLVDVVLGFDDLDSYLKSYHLPSAPYFGTTVGRYAGRIHKGSFQLNDKTFQLNQNNNSNTLHGGVIGFGEKVWKVAHITTDENPSIALSLLSEDAEENFPGTLQVVLTYTLTEKNELKLEYKATSTHDTIINLTHHSYFNLNGHDSDVLDQVMFVNADETLETNEEGIPTGKFTNLTHTKFDFRTFKNCPSVIDNSFVIESKNAVAAKLFSAKNNLEMNVYTDQPSVHVYVGGNCFNILKGKENTHYHSVSGICFETQNFPDAPNHKHFPNSILKKGEEYIQKTTYKFQSL
ncbi:aldose epimerase family protein [Flavobacterium pectinovorum]|uniref:aldose epimerase family protein n=1 Tax=Flavobacterium pectinovorum TaxID=29533 RepID=UPI001FAE74D9|nr:aldose epimerase family protein [Flavobacterium pectinovorum]MCI9846214.1 galactose mutarotase [Flavobacterium pectinovorum]